MEYVKLAKTDMEVSRVCLGTWAIGGWMWGGTDEKESIDTVHAALDEGVNFIDTAPVYGFGRSEEIVGKALEGVDRKSVYVATKVGLQWSEDGNVQRNSSPERIMEEVEDSLDRLGTDYVDLYQVHWPDPLTDLKESGQALADLLDSQKVKHIGVSNYSPDQMREIGEHVQLSTDQPPYNMFERGIEEDVKPYCQKAGIGLLTYGALCRGLLSGKMSKDRKFKGDDLRKDDPKFQEPYFTKYLQVVEELDEFAKEKHERGVLDLAVRWILDMGVDVAIWGARRPEQTERMGPACDWRLSEDDLEEIEDILSNAESPGDPSQFMGPPSRNGK